MRSEKSYGRPWLRAVGVAAACLAGAHALQATAGHQWFVAHAFAVAAPVALAAGAWLALNRRERALGARLADWVLVAASLFLLMLVPQWIEGELSVGHGLTLAVLRDCGLPTLVATGAALYAFVVVVWAQLLHDFFRRLDL